MPRRQSVPPFLRNMVQVLVAQYGEERVLNAVSAAGKGDGKEKAHGQSTRRKVGLVGATVLDGLEMSDPAKFVVLREFLVRLNDRTVLPDSQDIRQFASTAGLKAIEGKGRKEMIPNLLRGLVAQPLEVLKDRIALASGISEERRQLGFSVLTDKLMGNR